MMIVARKIANFISVDKSKIRQSQLLYTSPYQLKLFIHICADNNGSNLAVTSSSDFTYYLQTTRAYYAGINVCFSLTGMDTIYSTTLNNMLTDSSLHYNLLVSKLVPGTVNIFFHKSLADKYGTGFNGNAYDIPNYSAV